MRGKYMKKVEQGNASNPHKRAKGILLINVLVVLSSIAILLLAAYFLDNSEDAVPQANNNAEIDYDFYPADFTENIYDDALKNLKTTNRVFQSIKILNV